MKVNLHTHTYRCHHAKGTDEEYVLAALEAGYTKLGFADHTPFPYTTDFEKKNVDKMSMEDLPGYMASVRELKEKYRGQIEILLGLECESVPDFFPFLKEMREQMDYLILGNHGDRRIEPFFGKISTPEGMWRFVEAAVEGLETGLFLYLAHPDLMLNAYAEFDGEAERASRALCREANRLHIPLEYNLYGLYKGKKPGQLGYPCEEFWQIAAEENCVAVVGVDAHRLDCFSATPMEPAVAYLKGLGLTVLEDPTKA